MRGELRALKQHILQLEVEAGGVRHTALRRQFNAKLGEKRREALRAQNLVGGGGEELSITKEEYNGFETPDTELTTPDHVLDHHDMKVLGHHDRKAVMCARNYLLHDTKVPSTQQKPNLTYLIHIEGYDKNIKAQRTAIYADTEYLMKLRRKPEDRKPEDSVLKTYQDELEEMLGLEHESHGDSLQKYVLELVERVRENNKKTFEEVKGEVLRHNPPPPPKSRKQKPRHTGYADANPKMIEARAVYEQTNERMAEIVDEIDGYDIVYR